MLTHKTNTALFIIAFAVLFTASFYYNVPWWAYALTLIIYLIIAAIGSGLVWTGYHVKAYCRNPAEKNKVVAITFDDGPTEFTPHVLTLLKQYNVKATFFCIGKQIEKHPEILKQIVADGHTVGNHTYSHVPQLALYSKARLLHELEYTNGLIKEYSGKQALFFRPPYGVTQPRLAAALKQTGHKVIGWNIRSLDAVIKSEEKIFQRVKKQLRPGSIILLHDTSQKSVNVLEQLLVLLQQNNYEAVTVGRLLNIPAYEE